MAPSNYSGAAELEDVQPIHGKNVGSNVSFGTCAAVAYVDVFLIVPPACEQDDRNQNVVGRSIQNV